MTSENSGRVAVVTGAARGIGVAVARRLLTDGYYVLVVDRDGDGLAATTESLAANGNVAALTLDLSADEAPDRIVAEAHERLGGLDVLVNNAGVVPMGPFLETSDDDLDLALDVNVRTLFRLTRAVMADMVERGTRHGRIISLGTVNVAVGTLNTSAYSASKGAVSALTRQLAVELGPHGITCNEVAPGPVATERVRATLTPEQIEARRARIPTGVQPVPEDIAAAIAYVASIEASALNGQTLTIDGGFAIRGA